MGIVYAGCFYVFIDPGQPAARFLQILSVCRPACLLTDKPEGLPAAPGVPVLRPAELLTQPENAPALAAVRAQALDIDPLYCNFTSGSTGVPKGVLVCHRSVLDFIGCFPELFSLGEDDVLANQAPFDFDVSVKDIYTAFKTGARLVLVPRKYFSIVTELLDYLCENRVTTLIWAVSALCLVTQFHGFDYRIPKDVRNVLFSGELMPARYLRQWQTALPQARFVNLYGPTEITCNCTYYRVSHAGGRSAPRARRVPARKTRADESAAQVDNLPGRGAGGRDFRRVRCGLRAGRSPLRGILGVMV